MAKARKATRQIYLATAAGRFSKDFGLRDQIQRASVSVMANMAQGFGRHSDREFANFLNIAHSSVLEVQSHLYVALDLNYLQENTFRELYRLLDEVSRMTLALSKHLRGSKL
ncbi:MAG TPA: four helix bundle protein [Pyrinomonadaceae bacterium]|nr:four helix bundle protein [Pyrinomonadaceae bacterium]